MRYLLAFLFYVSTGLITPRDTYSLPRAMGENPISKPVRTARLTTLARIPTWECEYCDAVAQKVQIRLLDTVPTVKPLDLQEQNKTTPINQC